MISFIIPCYNSEKTICRCVNSIIFQNLKDYEILIINDGSTDKTEEIVKSKYSNNNKIKYFYKENEGQGIARNFGIKKAGGEYLTFIDSDDYYFKNTLNKIEEILDSQYDLYIYKMKKSNNKCNVDTEQLVNGKIIYNNINVLEGMLINQGEFNWIDTSACNKIYKKSIINQYNIYFKSERSVLSEDALFNFEYFMNIKQIVLFPLITYCYVMNASSFTHTYHNNSLDKLKNLFVELKEMQYDALNKEEVSELINYKIFKCIKFCIYSDFCFNKGKEIRNFVDYYNEEKYQMNDKVYFTKSERVFGKLIKGKNIYLLKIFLFIKKIRNGE